MKHRDEIMSGEEDYSETTNPDYCIICDDKSDNVDYDDPYVCKWCVRDAKKEGKTYEQLLNESQQDN